MRTRLIWLVVMAAWLIGWPSLAGGQEKDSPLLQRVRQVQGIVSSAPSEVESIFAGSFLKEVPAPALKGVLTKYQKDYGRVIRFDTITSSGFSGKFRFITDKDYSYTATVTVDDKSPHQVIGLFFSSGSPMLKTLDEVAAAIGKLPGAASCLVIRHDADSGVTLLAVDADRPLAIGSAFKLYVLGELARQVNEGQRKWSDVVSLSQKDKSLPSGILQDWPDGSPLTLHTLASLMISRSDNTATDVLLGTIGREKVEAFLTTAGMKRPELNMPFLSTMELIKIKLGGDAGLTKRYIEADAAARRKLLAEVAKMDSSSADASEAATKPVHIDRVEWFASAEDLSKALVTLRDLTREKLPAAPGRKILSINPGLSRDVKLWPYWGFKGGSEIGVLNLSLLLQRSDGAWFTVVATWNDAEQPVDEQALVGLMERLVDLLAKPPTPASSPASKAVASSHHPPTGN